MKVDIVTREKYNPIIFFLLLFILGATVPYSFYTNTYSSLLIPIGEKKNQQTKQQKR